MEIALSIIALMASAVALFVAFNPPRGERGADGERGPTGPIGHAGEDGLPGKDAKVRR